MIQDLKCSAPCHGSCHHVYLHTPSGRNVLSMELEESSMNPHLSNMK